MAIRTREVRHTRPRQVEDEYYDDAYLERETVPEERDVETARAQNTLSNFVWFIAWVILALLGIRFVLALLGANPSNGFVDFIYSTTQPLVSPFFGVFNYTVDTGIARLELYTLLAMLIYALIAYGISYLVTINRR